MRIDERFRRRLRTLLAATDGIREASTGIESPVTLEDGGEAIYTTGEHVRGAEDASESEGFRTLMGEIETASGHRFHALLGVCVEDVCEHYGTSLLVPTDDGWAWLAQGEGLEEWVADVNREVSPKPPLVLFPYRYRYLDTTLREDDPHLDEERWSRAW